MEIEHYILLSPFAYLIIWHINAQLNKSQDYYWKRKQEKKWKEELKGNNPYE